MDVILKVLEGAKQGAKIAIKKPEFIIGRSQSCHLCAGSSAISRQHCMITRDEARVAIKDLGSRNGTLVNGNKIQGEVELTSGDEVTIGPLKFLVAITAGLNNAKKPEVKSVAEAVHRAAEKSHSNIDDDEISNWLLETSALSETQTIRIDDTNAAQQLREAAREEGNADPSESETKSLEPEKAAEEEHDDPKKKKGPGKLPKIPVKPAAKDSREAAAEALRAWSRRR